MSNFDIFDKEHLCKLLEPFALGMTEHITPIKYAALTPDCFLLLFQTTGKHGEDHFFVSLEADFIDGLVGARCTIEDWHGEVIDFWPISEKRDLATDDEKIENYKVSTSGPYYAVLAEVKRPTHKGYWSEATTIAPGDNIGEKIEGYTSEEQANIRKELASILRHKVDPKASFLDSIQAKAQNTIVDDINMTDMAVSLFVQPDGKVEYFYNYVRPEVSPKDLKQREKGKK